jgi:hypothetical protein
MCCDIWVQTAWQCGDNDCGSPGGWHKTTYWCDTESETGYTVDNYSDGDHELCDVEDVPTAAEAEASWLDYSRWVAEHGEDPLGEFLLDSAEYVRPMNVVAYFSGSILGMVLTAIRLDRHSMQPNDAMRVDAVREYLTVERSGSGAWVLQPPPGESFHTPEQMVLSLGSGRVAVRKGRAVARFQFKVEVPRKDAAKRRRKDLIAAARKHIQRKAVK